MVNSIELSTFAPASGLVVDDDPVIRLVVRQVLEADGFTAHEACNGKEGVEVFGKVRPNIVLLDVMMPTMDGFAACTAIRSMPVGDRVPILMMTGLDDLESINRAFEVGATDFISKPINWGVLGHRIRYMLRNAHMLEQLMASRESLAESQRIARLGSWEWSPGTGHAAWSEETGRILGLEAGSDSPGMHTFLKNISPEDRVRANTELTALAEHGREIDLSYRLQFADSSSRYVHIRGFVRGTGTQKHVRGTIQDVTERKKAEEQIRYLANYDGLTGLPNRKFFMEHVKRALVDARRSERPLAVLSIDLNQFKRINDTLGQALGDQLLQSVANRLTDCIAQYESGQDFDEFERPMVARLGADEFSVMVSGLDQFQDAAKIAHRILDKVQMPILLEGDREVIVSARIGISIHPFDGSSAEILLGNANTAMHHAKTPESDHLRFYDRTMNETALRNLSLETQLRRAIDNEELVVYYQPKVSTSSGSVVGVEALVRWNHPQEGLIPPNQFIPIAEETGLIVPIGDQVIRAACRQLGAWHRAGYVGLGVAVNIAGAHFRQPTLLDVVDESLRSAGVSSEHVELEVTESMLMDDLSVTTRVLGQIRDLGVRLAMDDFGTGYSSLAYLKRFVLDTLKIDRSFISGLPEDPGDSTLVSAIIAMAHGMNLVVVAEGVEREEQITFLRNLSCDMIQGYVVSRPAPAEEITPLFDRLTVAAAV